jgi:ATP-dependent DNA helicase RecG
MRGPGEFFGTRQSGVPDLKVARLSDVHVLEAARRQAELILGRDQTLSLPDHARLRSQVEAYWNRSVAAG